jgi:hypothetical protein
VERNQVLAEVIRHLMALSLVVLAGCAAGPTGGDPNLKATLVSPTDIELVWRLTDPAAAGQIVEYANEENGQYTILGYLPPTQTTYKHPDLIPQTPFYYRVRPYYGTASSSMDVTLPPGEYDDTKPDDEEWVKPKTLPGGPADRVTVRDAGNAPTDFTVTVVHANGVKLTWTDRTNDEEGFLLEVKADGAADFAVAGVLDPDVNSFGMITLPNEKKATYRVRPYRFGQPTNVAGQTTGGQAG